MKKRNNPLKECYCFDQKDMIRAVELLCKEKNLKFIGGKVSFTATESGTGISFPMESLIVSFDASKPVEEDDREDPNFKKIHKGY